MNVQLNMVRVITTPAGQQVTIGQFVQAWRAVIAEPEREFQGWEWYAMKGLDIRRAMVRGMQDRITQGVPYTERGK